MRNARIVLHARNGVILPHDTLYQDGAPPLLKMFRELEEEGWTVGETDSTNPEVTVYHWHREQ